MKSDLISQEPVSTCHGDCGALTPEEAWKQLRPNLSILTPGDDIVSDLINRDALVEDFRRIARAQANAGIFVAADAWEGAADRLANAPAVDAELVRYGQWMPYYEPMEYFVDVYLNTEIKDVQVGWICSECGRHEQHSTTEEMPYCHCGAKMDAEVEG